MNSEVGYLIDMDGVIYKGAELIPGADLIIRYLVDKQIPFLFLTNNSQRTRFDVATKLSRLGIPVGKDRVFTCALATARFIAKEHPGATAYVIGEGGLTSALHQNGIAIVDSEPDFVIIGEGRSVSWDMLERATDMIYRGARLIATNQDAFCPIANGRRPGAGALVAMLECATGKKAFSLGKPSSIMMRMARMELGLRTSQVTMIGDTMETDVLGAVQSGFRSVLVLTGSTKFCELDNYAYRPHYILNSIAELPLDGDFDGLVSDNAKEANLELIV